MSINRMFYINKKQVARAGEFIKEYGKEIEIALFKHFFENEPASHAINILESHINPDGGVGGLDPDMVYSGSTPVNCAYFFSILHDLKVKAELDSANNVLDYLKENMQSNFCWIPIVPQVMDEPRGHWWNWPYQSNDDFCFNPTCELLGSFYHFGGGDYRAYAKEMLDNLYNELLRKFVGTLSMHDVISLMQLCRVLPDVASERFIDILSPHLKEMIVVEKSQWENYVLSPLAIFKSPLDPLYYDFEKEINLNLDYEIAKAGDDCVWAPLWHWGQYDEVFADKKNEITAFVTLHKLIQLKNFDRITKR